MGGVWESLRSRCAALGRWAHAEQNKDSRDSHIVGLTGGAVTSVRGRAHGAGRPPRTQPRLHCRPAAPARPSPYAGEVRGFEATVTTFNDQMAIRLVGWADNVVFDGHGGMWVSRVIGNEVQRFDPSGQITKVVSLEGPAGMAMRSRRVAVRDPGPDRCQRCAGRPLRSDRREPEPEAFATGLPGANGLAADDDGNLYVGIVGPMTIGQSPSLVKVLPDGNIDQPWSALADFPNANGIVVSGDNLYVQPLGDRNSPIEKVPWATRRGTRSRRSYP